MNNEAMKIETTRQQAPISAVVNEITMSQTQNGFKPVIQ
ncbi:hypothetical protein BSAF29S_00383 [Bacillus safensis subsp. safensis]